MTCNTCKPHHRTILVCEEKWKTHFKPILLLSPWSTRWEAKSVQIWRNYYRHSSFLVPEARGPTDETFIQSQKLIRREHLSEGRNLWRRLPRTLCGVPNRIEHAFRWKFNWLKYGHHHSIKTDQLEIPKSSKLLGAYLVWRSWNLIPLLAKVQI